jgi:hypothetical protein
MSWKPVTAGFGLVKVPTNLTALPVTGWRRNGHRLSLNGLEDANTLFGSGKRVCRICGAPQGLPEFDSRYLYNRQFGLAFTAA